VDEAEVEHLVGLVQHQVATWPRSTAPRIHQVDQPAGRGHEDVGAARQHADLFADGLAADHHATRSVDPAVSGRRLSAIWFTSSRVGARISALAVLGAGLPGSASRWFDQRQAEGQRLAGAGLGEAQDVVALSASGIAWFWIGVGW
jgi:hypothetical protein